MLCCDGDTLRSCTVADLRSLEPHDSKSFAKIPLERCSSSSLENQLVKGRWKKAASGHANEYQDECIHYKHKPWDSSKWDEIHQYHCREKCIKRMPEAHFEVFKKKIWVDKPAKDVVAKLSQ